jgi:hypothetical protein
MDSIFEQTDLNAPIERLVSLGSETGSLLTGLSWRAVRQARHSLRHLYAARELSTDASHYVLCQSSSTLVYGLFEPRASEEAIKLPKAVHSAAHCFASLVGQEFANAALVLHVPSSETRREAKIYVVVLEDGVPAVDMLTNEMEARNALGSEERPMWSDSTYSYPNAQVASFAWLHTGASKASRVAPIPINPWPVVIVAVALVLAGLGWLWMDKAKKLDNARAQAALKAQQDPVPKYLSALNSQAVHMASARSDFLTMVKTMFEAQVVVPGWSMSALDCQAKPALCTALWQRRGGALEDLERALPGQKLVLGAPLRAEVATAKGVVKPLPSIHIVQAQRSASVARTNWLAPGSLGLKTFDEQFAQSVGLWQVWETAGISTTIKQPELWPKVADVPQQFSHPQALQSGSLVVSDVPGPFVLEAVQSAPDWISWEAAHADLNDGDIRGRLKFTLTGIYYAKAAP